MCRSFNLPEPPFTHLIALPNDRQPSTKLAFLYFKLQNAMFWIQLAHNKQFSVTCLGGFPPPADQVNMNSQSHVSFYLLK